MWTDADVAHRNRQYRNLMESKMATANYLDARREEGERLAVVATNIDFSKSVREAALRQVREIEREIGEDILGSMNG